MASTTFANAFRKIDLAIKRSTDQALRRAGTSTKALFAKEISAQLGITSKRAKSRAKIINPNESNQSVVLSIGVRLEFAAHDFKPKKTKVDSRLGKRFGATYTVKGRSTVTVPNAFLVKGAKSGKNIIIQRVGDSRYPTKTVLVAVFRKSVEELRPMLADHLAKTFEKNYKSNLKFNTSGST